MIIKGYCEHLYAYSFDNLDEIGDFLRYTICYHDTGGSTISNMS